MKNLTFREATIEKDLEGILKVAIASFNNFYSAEKIKERLSRLLSWIYIAEENSELVGFKIWYQDYNGQIYSWLSAVHPEYRRKGISH